MKKISFFSIFRHVFLLSFSLLFLFPFIWMVLTSFKPEYEIFSNELLFFPVNSVGFANYIEAFKATPLLRFLLNGVFVTLMIFFTQVLVAFPCAYALAKHKFIGKDFLLIVVVACLLIPPQAISVPLYILMYKFGFLDTYAGLIAPFTISVFGIFLIRQFFNSVPDDLIHAARMDGYSEFAIVWKIMLPTTIPALVSFGIFSIVAHWNDYFWPLIVLSSEELFTPPLGVVAFKNDEAGNSYGPLMAAATIIILPLIIAFLAMQRKFVEGITNTGIK
ncbi:MAG: carbohydrate ABC transporter permease [Campylobacteraceae bacterium]|nr:carbohydrate ABC transporter permease [Campylobacteraceae bacterium]